MWKFLQTVNKEKGLKLKDYNNLYDWSIDQTAEFWDAVWQFTGIKASAPYDEVGGPLSRFGGCEHPLT
jgi:acetoacetyl-CoA synthetase